jgi:hypothetical protein
MAEATVDLETHACGGCGITWGAPTTWWNARREDGKGFYCPNGCSRVFNKGESKLQIAQRELERMKQDRARLELETLEALAAKENAERESKRLKKRASAGVCPCCNRTFSALARHIKTKHPEMTAQVVAIKGGRK